jgi:hypothetical protein
MSAQLVAHLREILAGARVNATTGLGVVTLGVDTLRVIIEALESRPITQSDIREMVEAAIDARYQSHQFTRNTTMVRPQARDKD